jgi:hypothetical protein
MKVSVETLPETKKKASPQSRRDAFFVENKL